MQTIILTWERYGCVAHTLQLVVNDGLKHDKEAIAIVEYCNSIIQFFRKSNHYSTMLKKATGKILLTKCLTRWNSIFLALERLYEVRSFFAEPNVTKINQLLTLIFLIRKTFLAKYKKFYKMPLLLIERNCHLPFPKT